MLPENLHRDLRCLSSQYGVRLSQFVEGVLVDFLRDSGLLNIHQLMEEARAEGWLAEDSK